MWFLNPGKEALFAVIRRILAPYVENLDLNKFQAGLWSGQFSVNGLELKRSALDKFRLPIDVLKGHLGHLTINIPWAQLTSRPAEIIIEDVYLLAVPAAETKYDPADEEERAQASKQERLKNAEVLRASSSEINGEDGERNQGVFESLVSKIVNNVQITVKNIHIRYEDSLSVPSHPFAVGVTLAEFSAVSTDEAWEPSFIQSTTGAIHKLANLDSLAVYFDTDVQSITSASDLLLSFHEAISHSSRQLPDHQFVLRPVSGEGRITLNRRPDVKKKQPKVDALLRFDEIAFCVDGHQYRDMISMVDMYHFYLRQAQYRRFRPSAEVFESGRPRALLRFAGDAVLSEVHDRHVRWSWQYFSERRDRRRAYVELFKRRAGSGSNPPLSASDSKELERLERELSYEDIRFYRSIAHSALRKERSLQQQSQTSLEPDSKAAGSTQNSGWLGWVWGSTTKAATPPSSQDEKTGNDGLTESQRKELYEAIEYEEDDQNIMGALPKELMKLRVSAELRRGSLALSRPRSTRESAQTTNDEIISVVFDDFDTELIQRPESLAATLKLGAMHVHDMTTPRSLYQKVIRMKTSGISSDSWGTSSAQSTPTVSAERTETFFFVHFEHKPLDGRADNAITLKMQAMEIIYHRGYVETIYEFLKPPASQLESVNALMSAAGETIDGFRSQTRAGFEHALQNHKTFDVQVDITAPIVIIPEDVTSDHGLYIVLDAGRILVGSELVKQEAVREVRSKRKQSYTDDDFRKLESLMYDKFSVDFSAVQLLMGTDIKTLMLTLQERTPSSAFHVLNQTDVSFLAQVSIVPDASSLPKLKVHGKLPSLSVCVSNSKYHGLMKMIDTCIPRLNEERHPDSVSKESRVEASPHASNLPAPKLSTDLRLAPGVFGGKEADYLIDEAEEQSAVSAGKRAPLDEYQSMFRFSFEVGCLRASLSKADMQGLENLLAEAELNQFAFVFDLTSKKMSVKVSLRSLLLEALEASNAKYKTPLVSSSAHDTENQELIQVHYARFSSPPTPQDGEDSYDQVIDIRLSTFVFTISPEPVINLYDFLMTTFVSAEDVDAKAPQLVHDRQGAHESGFSNPNLNEAKGQIQLRIQLEGIQMIFADEDTSIATLALTSAVTELLLRRHGMLVRVQLGGFSLVDDAGGQLQGSVPVKLLSIDGEELAFLEYETSNSSQIQDDGEPNSVLKLRSGALKLHFIEEPFHQLYVFALRFARLKSAYDAATAAAAQRASELPTQTMKFNINIQAPIIQFPSAASVSSDMIVVRLGEAEAFNELQTSSSRISCSLRGIQVTSLRTLEGSTIELDVVHSIDVTAQVTQHHEAREEGKSPPEMEIHVGTSDIEMSLTQLQYCSLMDITRSISRCLSVESSSDQSSGEIVQPNGGEQGTVTTSADDVLDLSPELKAEGASPASKRLREYLTLSFDIKTIRLHLFDGKAQREADFKQCGIARFTVNDIGLHLKMPKSDALEVELVLQTFTMTNTRSGRSKFREIIPAEKNREQAQLMVLYTASGSGTASSSLAIITLDSPKILLALDPAFALLTFFTSPFADVDPSPSGSTLQAPSAGGRTMPRQQTATSELNGPGQMALRFDLHNASITILENDEESNSQAIKLYIKQLAFSQQSILALTISQLGMSLITMPTMEGFRFLDDVDVALSLDSRQNSSHLLTSIELAIQSVTLRASIVDINLITSISLKALELYNQQSQAGSSRPIDVSRQDLSRVSGPGRSAPLTPSRTTGHEKPKVHLSQEKLSARVEGFRLVLIGDRYQLPILHLQIPPLEMMISDWSGEMKLTSSLAMNINYWNILNSHWEPLIDPWTLGIQVSRPAQNPAALAVVLSSKTRLDVNVTSTFVELALATMNFMDQTRETSQRIDGVQDAPYRIVNNTGLDLVVWHDREGSSRPGRDHLVQIKNGKEVDWRFDDPKTMRERLSLSRNNAIGVQLQGKSWEPLRSLPVDREGEKTYILRPRREEISDRILCDIKVRDNIKIVTLRSTFLVENQTLYPLELVLLDSDSKPSHSVQKLAPGDHYAVPIDLVCHQRIKIRPDPGFGYQWSLETLHWEQLIQNPRFSITCRSKDANEAPFRFQSSVLFDRSDPTVRKYPKLTLRVRAPIEIENLLPFDINYRVYDKNTNQNWTSFLRQGGTMPVHSVRLDHLVLLNIEIQDTGYKASDFAIIHSDNPAEFDIEKLLTISDKEGRILTLRLNYIAYPDSGGAFKVQIYSPFVLVNRLGCAFTLRSGTSKLVAGQNSSVQDLSSKRPFMFSHHKPREQEFSFRIEDSSWSKTVSFDAPSAETEIGLDLPGKDSQALLGLSWELGLGKYKLTKVVSLSPRFFLVNDTARTLKYREHGAPLPPNAEVAPGARIPLFKLKSTSNKLIVIACPGLDARWSAPIAIEDIGTLHVRMYPAGSDGRGPDLLKVVTNVQAATIFVTLQQETGQWPFKIENGSDFSITCCQVDDDSRGVDVSISRRPRYQIDPHASLSYAWDFPSSLGKKLLIVAGHDYREIDILEIGNLVPFKFRNEQGTAVLSLDVRAEGGVQTLSLTNYVEEYSLYRPRVRRQSSVSRSETLTGLDAFETIAVNEVQPSLTVTVSLEGVGISFINQRMIELLYLSISDIKVDYLDSEAAYTLNLAFGTLQVDNQLHDALFPVVLQPTPVPKAERSSTPDLPTIQASFMALKDESHGVLFIKYASLLLQALTVRMDEDFLFALLDFSKFKGAAWEEQTPDVLIQHPDELPRPTALEGGQELYFEVLELQPVRLALSFVRTERVNADEKVVVRNPIAVVINSITMALGNVNEAPLQLNSLAIKDARMSTPVLMDRVLFHYRQEVLRQLYRIIGSVDFIGNPVGLFTNVSSGIADVFYEPYRGVVMHGNKELGIGIAKGAASFVKKTVFGFSDSFSKVTGSIGKGLSSATFDSEFQRQRRMAQRQNKPRHAIYGVTAGAEALASSFQSGIEGVVMKPIEGAEAGGASGFFKGVGKGIVGVVAKPMVGVFDLASNVSEGIRNTTTVFDGPQRERARTPRHVPYDGILTPYSQRDALGQRWLRDVDNGQFRDESYVAHIELRERDSVALLTTGFVLLIRPSRLRSEWDIPFSKLQSVTTEDTGIRFSNKSGREYDHFVPVGRDSKQWFFKEIEKVVVRYNAQRRVER